MSHTVEILIEEESTLNSIMDVVRSVCVASFFTFIFLKFKNMMREAELRFYDDDCNFEESSLEDSCSEESTIDDDGSEEVEMEESEESESTVTEESVIEGGEDGTAENDENEEDEIESDKNEEVCGGSEDVTDDYPRSYSCVLQGCKNKNRYSPYSPYLLRRKPKYFRKCIHNCSICSNK